MKRTILSVLVALVGTACSSTDQDQIRVLSAGPLEDGLITIAEAYRTQTGHEVTLETGTTPVVREQLEAGGMFDVVIATEAVIDEAAARGQVDRSTAPVVGRVGVGIAVRQGIEVPTIQTSGDLAAVLRSADTVAYNRGSSGVYSQSMIESLGLTEEIAGATILFDNGTQVIAHVREGTGRDLGLAPLTEIQANTAEGIRMIPLPDDVQNYTSYHAVVGARAADAAADFIEFLSTPLARAAFSATGVD